MSDRARGCELRCGDRRDDERGAGYTSLDGGWGWWVGCATQREGVEGRARFPSVSCWHPVGVVMGLGLGLGSVFPASASGDFLVVVSYVRGRRCVIKPVSRVSHGPHSFILFAPHTSTARALRGMLRGPAQACIACRLQNFALPDAESGERGAALRLVACGVGVVRRLEPGRPAPGTNGARMCASRPARRPPASRLSGVSATLSQAQASADSALCTVAHPQPHGSGSAQALTSHSALSSHSHRLTRVRCTA